MTLLSIHFQPSGLPSATHLSIHVSPQPSPSPGSPSGPGHTPAHFPATGLLFQNTTSVPYPPFSQSTHAQFTPAPSVHHGMPIHPSSIHLPPNLPAYTTTRVRPPRPAVESLLGSADASPDVQAENARRHAERVRKGELGNAQGTGGSSARDRGAQGESARNAEEQNALDPARGGSEGTRAGQKPEVSEEIIADEKSDMAFDPTNPAPEPSAAAADARGEDEPLASSERVGASIDGEADAQPEPVAPTTPSPPPTSPAPTPPTTAPPPEPPFPACTRPSPDSDIIG